MIDPRDNNYYKKLMQLIEEGKTPPFGLCVIDVYHDDWCPFNRGGPCTCDPEVEVNLPPEYN